MDKPIKKPGPHLSKSMASYAAEVKKAKLEAPEAKKLGSFISKDLARTAREADKLIDLQERNKTPAIQTFSEKMNELKRIQERDSKKSYPFTYLILIILSISTIYWVCFN